MPSTMGWDVLFSINVSTIKFKALNSALNDQIKFSILVERKAVKYTQAEKCFLCLLLDNAGRRTTVRTKATSVPS